MSKYQILILGDPNVGKTIIFEKMGDRAIEKFDVCRPSKFKAGTTSEIMLKIWNKQNLYLYSMKGGDDYKTQRKTIYEHNENFCFILCYSVRNRDSFTRIKTFWWKELKEHRQIPIIIVGTDILNEPIEQPMPINEVDALIIDERIANDETNPTGEGFDTVMKRQSTVLIKVDENLELESQSFESSSPRPSVPLIRQLSNMMSTTQRRLSTPVFAAKPLRNVEHEEGQDLRDELGAYEFIYCYLENEQTIDLILELAVRAGNEHVAAMRQKRLFGAFKAYAYDN